MSRKEGDVRVCVCVRGWMDWTRGVQDGREKRKQGQSDGQGEMGQPRLVEGRVGFSKVSDVTE